VYLVNSEDEEEEEEEEENSSNDGDFSIHSKPGKKNNTPTTRARKRDVEDDEKHEERKRRKKVREDAAMKVNEIQVEKMNKMIEMLENYKKDTSFILTKMNMLGANIDELPSEKNEKKLLDELDALDQLQESTLVNATSTWAQPPKEPSNQAQPPNSLEKTGEDEFEKETNSKTIAPVVDTIYVAKDKTITDMVSTIKETEENAVVQLTGEDLRISRLSEEELGKESLAFMNEGRFEEAKNLYERHRKLKQK
jgi:hypothetical protein